MFYKTAIPDTGVLIPPTVARWPNSVTTGPNQLPSQPSHPLLGNPSALLPGNRSATTARSWDRQGCSFRDARLLSARAGPVDVGSARRSPARRPAAERGAGPFLAAGACARGTTKTWREFGPYRISNSVPTESQREDTLAGTRKETQPAPSALAMRPTWPGILETEADGKRV